VVGGVGGLASMPVKIQEGPKSKIIRGVRWVAPLRGGGRTAVRHDGDAYLECGDGGWVPPHSFSMREGAVRTINGCNLPCVCNVCRGEDPG
jgi:hypothetical protein